MTRFSFWASCLIVGCGLVAPSAAISAEPVRFGRDVLPILSANCFACHGPDAAERKADLRLDREDDAKAPRGDVRPIAPGKPDESEILSRLTSSDPDLVMPPPSAHRQVKPEQIALLRRWIAEGAPWGRHWSFEPLIKPDVPSATGRSPIDLLIDRELAKQGLTMRPAASPHQLARRLSLDLIGLPPTPETADAFAADPSAAAYERLVDSLLGSPRFGEHWARMWLDLARYADTKGYEKDLGRTMWPYRDWVVQAFNSDMPLAQFTREQLAGDLLPEPTDSQLAATAFHRNTMSNDEGGTDDEEFRVAAVKDRVDTTLQVWMGLTAGCAKCHTHKYDPISQAEYYSLFALLNQTQDADRPDDAPTMEILSPAQKTLQQEIQTRIQTLTAEKTQADEAAARERREAESLWKSPPATRVASREGAVLKATDDGAIAVSGKQPAEDDYTIELRLPPGTYTALRLEALPEAMPDGQWAVGRNARDPNFVISELRVELVGESASTPLKLTSPRSDFAQDGWPVSAAIDGDVKTGWAVSPRSREAHVALFDFAAPLRLTEPATVRVALEQRYGTSLCLRRFRLAFSEAETKRLAPRVVTPDQRRLIDALATAHSERARLNSSVVRLPILRERPSDQPRVTRIQRRGNFLDLAEEVEPGVPQAFHPWPEHAPRNRLGLARWLTSADNSLTYRVWVNRIWSRLFGVGLVETEEDMGTLGAAPANAALLDWLAADYRDHGGSLKALLKTIVLSDAYRQSSDAPPERRAADPANRLISRGARYRLTAETIRDQALAVSGLLSAKQGGPSVMPPQPEGLWRSTYNGQKWISAEGEDRYRRGLYTYLKRTTPYPSMTTFDGGSGEVCQIRRIRTNTPLQALVTLNDPVFLEASAGLARRLLAEPGDVSARCERGLRLALARPVREGESAPLFRLQKEMQASYESSPEKAAALLKASRAHPPEGVSPGEFAAWVVIANTILNLDEFLTRN